MYFGFLILFGLSGLALAAAIAVAVRARFSGRAEQAVAVWMAWNFLIIVPIYALGLRDRLTAPALAGLSLLTSGLVLASTFQGVARRAHAQAIGSTFLGLLRLPWDGLRLALQARSVIFVGLVLALGIWSYTAWLAYLAPSDHYDALWYHEPMVGFAIQNRGFSVVALPPSLQNINGYPRLCAMTNLWFVIFTDRRLIEVVNNVMGPALVFGTYVLAARFSRERLVAMGLAIAVWLMPGTFLELKSSYIDVHTAAFVVCGLVFATRPQFRLRDACFAGMCCTMLVAAKGHGLMWMPPVALIAMVRVLVHHRNRTLASLAVIVGGAALIVGFAATTYWRNYVEFKNPFWAAFSYDNEKWDIHWPKTGDVYDTVDFNKPPYQLLKDIYSPPKPGNDYADIRLHGYGLGMPWATWPVAALALAAAFALFVRDVVFRRFAPVAAARDAVAAEHARTRGVLLVALPMLATCYFSPALWSARYNLHASAALLCLVAWASGFRAWRRLGEGVAAANIVCGAIMLVWVEPGWMVSFDEALSLARVSAFERETSPVALAPISREVAWARETELGPGTVVAISANYGLPGLLWSRRFENRVVWVRPERERFLKSLDDVGATWVIAGPGDGVHDLVLQDTTHWERIGVVSRPVTEAFRRRR